MLSTLANNTLLVITGYQYKISQCFQTDRVNVEQLNRRLEMKIIKKLFKNENGATAIEYGLIAALIAVAAITAMTSLGTNLSNTFGKVNNQLVK